MGNVGTVPDTPEVHFWQEDYPFLIRREIAVQMASAIA
jgi:hypothetical protein